MDSTDENPPLDNENDLLTSFDEYHHSIQQKLLLFHQLENENYYLDLNYKNILNENNLLLQLLSEKENELEQVTKKLLTLLYSIISKIQNFHLSLNQQEEFLTLQYDYDILLTNYRNLEKDLMLQKIENERLRNSNNQFIRELQSYQQQKK